MDQSKNVDILLYSKVVRILGEFRIITLFDSPLPTNGKFPVGSVLSEEVVSVRNRISTVLSNVVMKVRDKCPRGTGSTDQ